MGGLELGHFVHIPLHLETLEWIQKSMDAKIACLFLFLDQCLPTVYLTIVSRST
jgi:hypothetical protein